MVNLITRMASMEMVWRVILCADFMVRLVWRFFGFSVEKTW